MFSPLEADKLRASASISELENELDPSRCPKLFASSIAQNGQQQRPDALRNEKALSDACLKFLALGSSSSDKPLVWFFSAMHVPGLRVPQGYQH
jgi:hypothetical protein